MQQYCRAKPTQWWPCFAKPVSSTIHQPPSEKSIAGTTHCATRRNIFWSNHGESATKWCSDWWRERVARGAMCAAIGSTLLRERRHQAGALPAQPGLQVGMSKSAQMRKVALKLLQFVH